MAAPKWEPQKNDPPRMAGMIHLNDDLLCVVDIETTSTDVETAEILEIAILPLDHLLNPHPQLMPFHMSLKPLDKDAVDFDSMSVNKRDLADAILNGVDPNYAADLLRNWFDAIKLPFRKKIVPLWHNGDNFDKPVLERWLGKKEYDSIFSFFSRCTMKAAVWMNDRAFFESRRIPFPKVNLQYLAATLRVATPDHTALADCAATAQVYKRLLGTVSGIVPETNFMDQTEEEARSSTFEQRAAQLQIEQLPLEQELAVARDRDRLEVIDDSKGIPVIQTPEAVKAAQVL